MVKATRRLKKETKLGHREHPSLACWLQSTMEVPSHRACAFCRSQKVRCIVDEENEEACQRCAKAGRTCVFTPIQKRKQRKRTDTRVAELEREMKAMRSMLKEKQQATQTDPPVRNEPPQARGLWFKEHSQHAPREDTFDEPPAQSGKVSSAGPDVQHWKPSGPLLWPNKMMDRPPEEKSDVIDRGVISMAAARQLFDSYRTELFPHYPMVYVPGSVTADEIRQAKPTLFLAILAAAAGKGSPEVSAVLDKEVLQTYAMKSLVHSEKSLELVQSLLLSSFWYHPPNKFGQLKYYEYIHMAATMALDIGIGTRKTNQRSRFGRQQPNNSGPNAKSMHPLEDAMNPDLSMTPRSRDCSPDTGSVEARRTFLACFIICATISMSLRRPNMLRASSYIRESVDFLEVSRDAVPSDRTVVAWVKLIMIQDEIGNSFAYDDPGGIACITELRTQLMLKDFERRLTDWWTTTPEIDMTGTLIITYYTTRLYLHEIALHVDHSPEDFKAPYQMGVIEGWQGDEIPSQILSEGIAECINCSHSLLNTFLSMPPEGLRALPVFSFVRVSFAAFVLAKLCLSAAHPDSRIGRVLDRSSLKAESYLERAIHHVREVVGEVRNRVPAIFLALLFKLRAWCLRPEMIEWPDTGATENPTAAAKLTSQPQLFQRAPDRHPDLVGSALEEQRLESQQPLPRIEQQAAFSSVDNSASNTSTAHELTPQSLSSDGTINQAKTAALNFGSESGAITIPQTPADGVDDFNSMSNVNTMTNNEMNDIIEHMELDSDFLNYFGDMTGLAEGGLTGLEDWGALPSNPATNYDGVFGYQFETATGGQGAI